MFVIVPISWGFWELIVVAAGFPLIGLVVCCVWSLYCVCWFSSLFLINDFCLSKKKKKKKKTGHETNSKAIFDLYLYVM